jgi:hypothetical protein
MAAVTLTTDRASFKRGVNALAKQYGVEVKTVMLRQVSIVGGQLIKAFPPLKAEGKPGGLKTGKAAIENDVRGGRSLGTIRKSAGVVQTDANIIAQWDASIQAGVSGKVAEARVFRSRSGAIYGVDRALYKPNASPSEIAAHVEKYRSKKTGRVTTAGSFTRDIGRWKFVDKLYVNEKNLQKFLTLRSKRVGNLAAGWLPTLNIYRGPGAGKKAAAFVSRHAPGNGSVVDKMRSDGSGEILFSNNVKYASRWGRQNDFVLKKREAGMRRELKAAVKAAAQKARAAA